MKGWKRFGNYMPILATVAVVGCVAMALKGYAAPVYEVEQPETFQSAEADAKEKKQETEETEQAKKGNFDLADGFYKGSGTGFAGTVSVSVEIKDKSIVAINILSTQDDEAFFNRAKGVIDKIIAGQTLDVDVVSGATYSSNGIISTDNGYRNQSVFCRISCCRVNNMMISHTIFFKVALITAGCNNGLILCLKNPQILIF